MMKTDEIGKVRAKVAAAIVAQARKEGRPPAFRPDELAGRIVAIVVEALPAGRVHIADADAIADAGAGEQAARAAGDLGTLARSSVLFQAGRLRGMALRLRNAPARLELEEIAGEMADDLEQIGGSLVRALGFEDAAAPAIETTAEPVP